MWDFINIIRAEYPVEYAFIHPMLCDEDGERFLGDFLRKDRLYFVAGCAPVMQKKLFRDAFASVRRSTHDSDGLAGFDRLTDF